VCFNTPVCNLSPFGPLNPFFSSPAAFNKPLAAKLSNSLILIYHTLSENHMLLSYKILYDSRKMLKFPGSGRHPPLVLFVTQKVKKVFFFNYLIFNSLFVPVLY